jgi:spermidine dehydrogenase
MADADGGTTPNGNTEEQDGISRRDFLDGAAITAAGLAAAAASPYMTGAEAALVDRVKPLPEGYYPPTFNSPKIGHPNKVVRQTMKVDGRPITDPDEIHSTDGGPGIHRRPRRVKNTGETFDCVIVGAGASGLASAKFYRDRFGADSKILVIDPLPDFGGHCKRNEFHIPNAADGGNPVTILRNGGVVNMDSIATWNEPAGNLMDIPGEYGQPALDLLDYLEVDVNDDSKWEEGGAEGIPGTFGLRQMLLFPSEDYDGTDYCIPARNQAPYSGLEPNTPEGWAHFLDRTPYSNASKQSIIDCQTTDQDWLANAPGAPLTVEQKLDYLTRITYKRYLTHHVGVTEEAFLGEYWRGSASLLGTGGQAVGAADCWMLGRPGFPDALGLPSDTTDIVFSGIGRTPQMGAKASASTGPTRDWPDGNTSLLRLLVSKLIPQAFPDVEGARPDQVTIVKADCDYSQLDRPGRRVRIRLNSFVYRVKPGRGPKDEAIVEYLQRNGKARRVRAKHVVMACWNRVTAQVVEGLPDAQVEGLCYARKVPIIYGRAGLRNWNAWADSQISSVSPRGASLFWNSMSLTAGAGFGPPDDPVYGPTPADDPNAPATLTFTAFPNDPEAFPQTYAYETGRRILLTKTFNQLEREVVDMLDRSVNKNGGDFDAERDVESWKINRWNYGYAHELSALFDPSLRGPWEEQPQRRGCVPFRNVAIGNSDSQAMAYTHAAIQEGYRAVQDLP